MAKITDNQLQSLLKNIKLGTRNHYVSDCPLPNCQKEGHFFIQRNTQLWDCKKCKNRGNIVTLLTLLGKLTLLGSNERIIEFEESLTNKIKEFEKDLQISDDDLKIYKSKLPIGYKRVYSDDYLKSRGFIDSDFEIYPAGTTKLLSVLREYIIFPVYEDDEIMAYLSRSKKSKKEINLINEQYKLQGNKKKYLRWKNSKSDFSKLLYGINEITSFTHTAILVEGIFAKRKIDICLELYTTDEIKCQATFGKSVSRYQIYKLLKKGIKNIVLLFDDDAVQEIKKFSFDLELYFDVKIGIIKQGEDIDDMTSEQVNNIFDKLLVPFEYFNDVCFKKIKYERGD